MSGSRAAGVSLSQYLTTAISELPETTVKTLNKNKNDLAGKNKNIKQEACEKYLKDYKKFVNEEIDRVTHPVTKKQLTRKDRIDFIAEQCRTAFNLSVSGSKSKSKSKSRSKSDDEDSPYKNLKTPLAFKDIDKILEYPTKTEVVKNKHILSLFRNTKGLKIEQATEILKKYLEDPEITDTNVLLYRKIQDNIRENFVRNYSPFMLATTFNKYIKNNYYEGGWRETRMNLVRTNALLTKANNLFKDAIFYGDDNKTADDFRRNTKDNYYKYYAIEFMLLQLKKLYNHRNIGEQAQLYLRLIDKLIEGTINITDPDASVSFENSPVWSASPEDPILKAQYKTDKKTELERIMDVGSINDSGKEYVGSINDAGKEYAGSINDAGKEYAGSINDADFYTMDEWKDMSLRKLKSVIVIPYQENGKTYANAYYVKSLYKAWYMAVKDNKPFLNPANRKEFSQEDKTKILKVIQDLYPGLKAPRYGTTGGRSDISVTYTNDYITTTFIKIHYQYSCQETYAGICKHLLLQIQFPSSFVYTDDNRPDDESVVPLAYNPTFLFDMINNLMRQNKIIGKKVPFKIAEPFKELSNLDRIITKTEYMRFFDKLRLML